MNKIDRFKKIILFVGTPRGCKMVKEFLEQI